MLYKMTNIQFETGGKRFSSVRSAFSFAEDTNAHEVVAIWPDIRVSSADLVDYMKSKMYKWVGCYSSNYKFECTPGRITITRSAINIRWL